MRIATSQVFLNNINSLSEANSKLFKTQQQISTGKKVLQPSDDPLAAAQIIKLKKEVARNDQFQGNIEVSNRRLALEEITLDQLFNEGIRLKELTIQAGDLAYDRSERAALASEVGEILGQMLGLMNTTDVQGEYIFSGFKGETTTYQFDELKGEYVYQGDSGQRYIQIGPSNHIASTDSGMDLFERGEGAPRLTLGSTTYSTEPPPDPTDPPLTQPSTGVVSAAHITNFKAYQDSLDAGIQPYAVSITDTGNGPVLSVASADGSDVFLESESGANLSSPGIPVAEGDRINFNGLEIVIGSLPPAPTDVSATTTETRYSVDIGASQGNRNILNIALELKNGLQDIDTSTEDGKAQLDELLARTLTDLESVQDVNMRSRGSIGARMNALEQQEMVNEDYQLFTKEALSSFEDLEYNEALSNFALQQATLQAAYSSFSQISGLSLFNYIQ